MKVNENRESVPFLTYEAEMTRKERTIKRLWLIIISLIGVLGITNIAWLIMR